MSELRETRWCASLIEWHAGCTLKRSKHMRCLSQTSRHDER